MYKGGSYYYTIVSSTPSNGFYLWQIADTTQAGNDYRVKITSVDFGSITDMSDGNFSLYNQQITVTAPNGGESWSAGNNYGITWTDNIVEQVKIDLYKGGTYNYTIADSTASDGFYSWYIPDTLQSGGDYRVKITSVANSSTTDQSDGNFTISPNQISVTSPNGGENWQTGYSQGITWTDNINENVKIELYKGGSYYYTIVSSTPSNGFYLWQIADTTQAGNDYRVKITSVDFGSITDMSDGNFSLYNQQITITAPNGGESWSAGNNYGITWTDNIVEQVKIDLYKGGTYNYTIADSTASDGFYSWYIPDTLQSGGDYRVKITSVANSSTTDNQTGTLQYHRTR